MKGGSADLAAIDSVTWALMLPTVSLKGLSDAGSKTHQWRVIGMAPILCPALLTYVINSGASPSEIAAVQRAPRKAVAGCVLFPFLLSRRLMHPKLRAQMKSHKKARIEQI